MSYRDESKFGQTLDYFCLGSFCLFIFSEASKTNARYYGEKTKMRKERFDARKKKDYVVESFRKQPTVFKGNSLHE